MPFIVVPKIIERLTTPPEGGVWPRMPCMRLYKLRLSRVPDAALRRHGGKEKPLSNFENDYIINGVKK